MTYSARTILLCCLVRAAVAAPVANPSNSTQSATFVGYVSEPNVRGTSTLVISCLLTLILCVWSALHLNVPQQNTTRMQTFWCNVRWIITGVYAPELVVFTAWRQWASAKILGKLVAGLLKEPIKPASSAKIARPITREDTTTSISGRMLYKSSTFADRRHKWTKTHDFFASTGGFAFEISTGRHGSDHLQFLPETCPKRLTLTARGVALLAKCNRLPDVPVEDILDKSKANDLAKALVIVQASWMVLQTLGRLIVKLPVTLLEVNTIAHVGCVFVMYLLWWDKPLLPNEPFILVGDWVEPICAYMYMSSDLSGEVEKKEAQTMFKTMLASLNWYSKLPELDSVSLRLPKPSITEETASITEPDSNTQIRPHIRPAFESSSTFTACLEKLRAIQLEKAPDTAFFERRPKVKRADHFNTLISPITSHRLTLALQAIDEYPAIRRDHTLFVHEEDTCIHFKPEEMLVTRVQNWPSNDLLRNVGGLTVGMVLWMASLAYGAVHAAAWNGHFPSVAEKWIWRASATYIGFAAGLWIILNYVAQAYKPLNEFWEGWMDGKGGWLLTIIIGFLVAVCGMSFGLARVYIVVEAVISIRSLPAAAYDTPDWSQVFPHL